MGKSEIIIFIVLLNVVLLIFIAGIITFLFQYRKKKLLHEKEKSTITENHKIDILNTRLNSQRQTMQHIGQEIHDNVGQKLTLASLYTQQLVYENKAPQINDKIENIGNIINESLAELRQLSKSLTDDNINDNNITELLRQECNRVTDLKKCNVVFKCSQKNIGLSYQTKSILLRIVQEFLQNSIKHANCKTIQINLITTEKELRLCLQDDGNGFEITTNNNGGIGLSNMKKRAELIGGIYHLESTPNKGTCLNIIIPL